MTEAQFANLRRAFGDRVRAAQSEEAAPPPGEAPNAVPDVVFADVAGIEPLAEEVDGRPVGKVTGEDQFVSWSTPPSFAFPQRRPVEN